MEDGARSASIAKNIRVVGFRLPVVALCFSTAKRIALDGEAPLQAIAELSDYENAS